MHHSHCPYVEHSQLQCKQVLWRIATNWVESNLNQLIAHVEIVQHN